MRGRQVNETMGYGSMCCGPGFSGRRYLSRQERVEWLNEYAKSLENELQGVKERVRELQEDE